ncbi:flagellar assembly protein FliH [Aliiruegeria haliotis]|uniref:Flagellar assembly protein FliH n=1 Tax=Aliiruegeria haliotis TaxID=1280846 RepID=A0A2T0RTB1_9RHOB|nr:ABC transporter ATP-binding protein [Aliiruegeria haliotis]PRY24414.1 flagellar assembly protein FliH [Aliiruegeria haliotis]
MGRPIKLECFDNAFREEAVPTRVDVDIEDEKLKSFDSGYRAGWEDAANAHSEEQARISSELAGNLQALSFTYHEARSAILSELEGLLRGVVDSVLPGSIRDMLGETVLSQIASNAEGLSDVTLEIVVSPDNIEVIEALIQDRTDLPATIAAEASLGAGQAFLRIGESERKIDLDSTLEELSASMTAFFEQSREPTAGEMQHA